MRPVTIIVAVLILAALAAGVFFLNSSLESAQKSGGFESKTTVTIKVDKEEYKAGEKVNIIVKNEGPSDANATFLSASLGLIIRDDQNRVVFAFVGAQVLTTLKAGESREFEWDQKDGGGATVEPGTYTATVVYSDDRGLESKVASTIKIVQ
ncbi:MAG: hypothetical protein HYU02_01665 [Thaumarchaeota archaeon]|nr:hypothetical protein [Nitrososphaerota archaeon]